jgi:glucokinase
VRAAADSVRPSTELVIALDVGGTKLAAALVTTDGVVVHHDTVPTPPVPVGTDHGTTVWSAMAGLVDRVRTEAGDRPVVGAGIGSAGPVNPVAGTVSPVNIPTWRAFPLVEHVAAQLGGLPVLLAGDGICAAIGEHWRGAGRGVDDLLGMVASTGVGGGLVMRGRVHHGGSGNAGHIGHAVVDVDGPSCACGGKGCLEAVASGPRLLAWAVEQGWHAPDGAAPSVPALAAQAALGDPVAEAAFARAGRAVGAAIVSVAATCDITTAVVGGGVANVGELLFGPIRAAIAEHAHLPFLRSITVERALLGGSAGLVGAAALVLEPDRYGARPRN